MRYFLHEVFHAFRRLLQRAAISAVIVSIIALTIGINGLIFGLVCGILLRALPYPDPERIVMVWEENLPQGYHRNTVSLPNFEDWHRQAKTFEALAAWKHEEDVLTRDGEPERLVGAMVTSDYFAVLGVQPLLGRTFGREESAVVLISESLWRRRFGSSQEIIGRTILLDGNPYSIIGVTPEAFDRPLSSRFNEAEFWRPMEIAPRMANRGTRFLRVLGRTSGDVATSRDELSAIAGYLENQFPENKGWRTSVVPLREEVVQTARPVLLLLWTASLLVLVIGCTNIANILLARAASREQEIAVRLSLGASPWRLVSLFASESFVLVLPGSLLGFLLAGAAGRLVTRRFFNSLPRIEEIDLGRPVLQFTLLLAILITLATAVPVALQVVKLDLGGHYTELRLKTGVAPGTRWKLDSLATLQVTLTFPLVVSTIVLAENVRRLGEVDLGFEPQDVFASEVVLPESRYGGPEEQRAFFQDLLARLEGERQIVAASAINDLPLTEWDTNVHFRSGNIYSDTSHEEPSAQFRVVAPGYFHTMRIRRLRGRDFDSRDRGSTETVLIVNEALAQRFLGGRDPVDERISCNHFGRWREGLIVGVVGDVRHGGPAGEREPTIYAPFLQFPSRRMTILARADSKADAITAVLRREIVDLDRSLPASEIVLLEHLYDAAVSGPRLQAGVLGMFGILAITLTALGVYGVVSYATETRRHEIGVRLALGATRPEILSLVLRHGAGLCLWGTGAGAVLELGVHPLLESYFYGAGAPSAATYLAVVLLLLLVGVAASLSPASSAVRLAPSLILKDR